MIHRPRIGLLGDPVWAKTLSISMGLFFVFFADAILSYWVPVFLEKSLGGSLVMGLVMSFSSLVGFGVDLIFPQLLKGTSVRRLMVMAIISSFMFSGVLLSATWWPVLAILLTAMGIWGVYYELMGFANQQFVAQTVPLPMRSGVWAVIGVFKSMAYFLGPIVAGLLIDKGDRSLLLVTASMTVLGYAVFSLMKNLHQKVSLAPAVELKDINLAREIGHWSALFVHVWPVILISVTTGLIDATFWTVGTVWSEKLSAVSWWGTLFLPLYVCPSLFVGLLVAKWGVYEHKKKYAEVFMLGGGVLLAGLGLNSAVWWQLALVFLSSAVLAVNYPLTEAVYSDIVARMGRERKHLIGLSNSTLSVAYIVGPVLAGGIAQAVGEQMTFVAAGGAMAVMAGVLLLVTPRKIKLPQVEIRQWQD